MITAVWFKSVLLESLFSKDKWWMKLEWAAVKSTGAEPGGKAAILKRFSICYDGSLDGLTGKVQVCNIL